MEPPAVAPPGVDAEGGVLADGVGVVVVVALPGVVVGVEDEVAGEEEHLGAHLTALAHPLTVQPHRQVGAGGQDEVVQLVGAEDNPDDGEVGFRFRASDSAVKGKVKGNLIYSAERTILRV